MLLYGQKVSWGRGFPQKILEKTPEAQEQMKYIVENSYLWWASYNRGSDNSGNYVSANNCNSPTDPSGFWSNSKVAGQPNFKAVMNVRERYRKLLNYWSGLSPTDKMGWTKDQFMMWQFSAYVFFESDESMARQFFEGYLDPSDTNRFTNQRVFCTSMVKKANYSKLLWS